MYHGPLLDILENFYLTLFKIPNRPNRSFHDTHNKTRKPKHVPNLSQSCKIMDTNLKAQLKTRVMVRSNFWVRVTNFRVRVVNLKN
jgi:hypothetical protein